MPESVLDNLLKQEETKPTRAARNAGAQRGVNIAQAMASVHDDTKTVHEALLAQDKVNVSLAPQYRPYFGKVMTVSLNGIPIYLPVNGRQYAVPRDYAAVIHGRRRAVDDLLMKTNRMADVRNNFETYAGELKLG
jgi:hypothetical protein